jgi:signal transduction histidine kinase
MRRRLAYIIMALMLLAGGTVRAFREQAIDSLSRVLAITKDSSRIGLLLELSWCYQKDDPEKMLYYADAAIKLCEIYGKRHSRAVAFRNKGTAYRNLASFKEASTYFVMALKDFEAEGDVEGCGNVYNSLGSLYFNMEEDDKAAYYYRKSIECLRQTKNRKGLAACYNNLGNIYGFKRNYPDALKLFNEALKIREELGDSMGLASTYGNLGLTYTKTKRYDEALMYQMKSLKIRESLGDQEGSANTLNNIGEIYLDKAEYPGAVKWFKKGLETAKEAGMFIILKWSHQALSECYERSGDYRNAYIHAKQYQLLRDSSLASDARAGLDELMTKYETSKKEQKLLLLKKDRQLQDQKNSTKEQTIQLITGALVIVALMIVWLVSLYIQKRKANSKLLRLDHDKNEFLSIAAHDLKMPLTTIIGYCRMQTDYYDKLDSDKLKKYAHNIQLSARRMVDLISNLLDINAIEEGKIRNNPEIIELEDFFRKMLNEFELLASRKNIRISLESPGSNCHVHADPRMLSQVTGNLLNQAISQSPEDSLVTVRLIREAGRTGYELEDHAAAESNGSGQKGIHSGNSGYSVIKRIAEMMGAEIDVADLGHGAKFRILFVTA